MEEEGEGTVVAKRQRDCIASVDSGGEVDWDILMREGLEWLDGANFRVLNEMRGRLLIEAASLADLPIAMAYCKMVGWGGHTVDHEASFGTFRTVAEQGDSSAQCILGLFYANGNGVAKDEAEAVKWFRKAAEQGDSSAQTNLGRCYAKGNGVVKDKFEAVKWFRKAGDAFPILRMMSMSSA